MRYPTGRLSLCFVLLALIFLAAPGSAIDIEQRVSGTFANAVVDFNGDGIPGTHVIAGTKGSLGEATLTGLQEGTPVAPTGNCVSPDPNVLLQDLGIITGAFVHRFANGDLLFAELVQGGGCLDLNTLAANVTLELAVTGGTGRFEGASGSYELSATAQPLQATGPTFGAFTGTIRGSIDLNGN